jgi:hypothetical protein
MAEARGKARQVVGEQSRLQLRVENEIEFAAPRKEDLEDHGDVLRAATDYVASLTEQDAEILFRRLTGGRLGALTDVLHA